MTVSIRLPAPVVRNILLNCDAHDMDQVRKVSKGFYFSVLYIKNNKDMCNIIFKNTVETDFPEHYEKQKRIPRNTWKVFYFNISVNHHLNHRNMMQEFAKQEKMLDAANGMMIASFIISGVASLLLMGNGLSKLYMQNYLTNNPGSTATNAANHIMEVYLNTL